MVVLPDDGQVHRVIEHIGQSFGGQKRPSDERVLRRVPEGIVLLLQSGNIARLEVLLRHILNNVIPVRQLDRVPPVAVPRLPVDHLHLNRPLFHVNVLLFAFRVGKQHLHAHRNVSLEFFGDQIQLDALGQGLQKLLLEVIFLLYFLLLFAFSVLYLFLLAFDLLPELMRLLFSELLLHLSLLDFLLLLDIPPHFLRLLKTLLQSR